jgi:hypothetical protein
LAAGQDGFFKPPTIGAVYIKLHEKNEANNDYKKDYQTQNIYHFLCVPFKRESKPKK